MEAKNQKNYNLLMFSAANIKTKKPAVFSRFSVIFTQMLLAV